MYLNFGLKKWLSKFECYFLFTLIKFQNYKVIKKIEMILNAFYKVYIDNVSW